MKNKKVNQDVADAIDIVDKSSISKALAKKALEDDKKERVENCRREIEEILNKYKCALSPMIVLRQGNVDARIDMVALDDA